MNTLKVHLTALLLSMAGLLSAQDKLTGSDDINFNPMAPTIVKIDFPNEMSSKRVHQVSTENEKFVNGYDATPIDIQRDKDNTGKLYIKGRGTLNHIRIFKEGSVDEYPLIDHTFRGVNFEEINIADLTDGHYRLEYISPHTTTEMALNLYTTGTN